MTAITMRRLPVPAWLLILILLALSGCGSDGPTANKGTQQPVPPVNPPPTGNAPQPNSTGQPLSANLLASPIKTVDGKTLKLADYKGKVVLVNFWATWCGPCRDEMPHLVKLRQDLNSKGFEVIGVTHVGQDPDPEAVKMFAKQFKITYPIGYAESNLILGLQSGTGVKNNIPQSFIISREGNIIQRFVGFGGDYPAQMRATVERALSDEKTGD